MNVELQFALGQLVWTVQGTAACDFEVDGPFEVVAADVRISRGEFRENFEIRTPHRGVSRHRAGSVFATVEQAQAERERRLRSLRGVEA